MTLAGTNENAFPPVTQGHGVGAGSAIDARTVTSSVVGGVQVLPAPQ